MPVTFGSVGDIIVVCQLVAKLITALDDCRGSAHEFQQLSQQLDSFQCALYQVEELLERNKASSSLYGLQSATNQVTTNFRSSVELVLTNVESYRNFLKQGGCGQKLRDAKYKIQWKTYKSKELEKFSRSVVAHTASLHAVLQSVEHVSLRRPVVLSIPPCLWGSSTPEAIALCESRRRRACLRLASLSLIVLEDFGKECRFSMHSLVHRHMSDKQKPNVGKTGSKQLPL